MLSETDFANNQGMKDNSVFTQVSQDLRGLSTGRKHIYFYVLLALTALVLGRIESLRSHASPIQVQAAQTDELKTLVQNLY